MLSRRGRGSACLPLPHPPHWNWKQCAAEVGKRNLEGNTKYTSQLLTRNSYDLCTQKHSVQITFLKSRAVFFLKNKKSHLSHFSVEVTLPMSRVEVWAGVEVHNQVEPRRHKCLWGDSQSSERWKRWNCILGNNFWDFSTHNFCGAVPGRVKKFILPLVNRSVSIAGVADLKMCCLVTDNNIGKKLLKKSTLIHIHYS